MKKKDFQYKDLSTLGQIIESSILRFFADAANPAIDDFRRSLTAWPAAAMAFMKIHPTVLDQASRDPRWGIAEYLRGRFCDAYVFFGFGYSELLLLVGGSNLPDLLGVISASRILSPGVSYPADCEEGATNVLFSGSMTVPLTSLLQVHAYGDFDKLEGQVAPVIAVSCDPGYESQIVQSRPNGAQVRSVYGKSDLVLYWDAPLGFSEFARCVAESRKKWSDGPAVTKTSSYLELPWEAGDTQAKGDQYTRAKGGHFRLKDSARVGRLSTDQAAA